eukprot:GDKJ01047870.1.p1 GENE.GDKJ01047870.1~~GDKJ01047870.1.p1  ORF type:complete len:532 (-),score=91.61 GDKJ01047870.1:215-1810(-)
MKTLIAVSILAGVASSEGNLRRLTRLSTLRNYYNVNNAVFIVNTPTPTTSGGSSAASVPTVNQYSGVNSYDFTAATITCPDSYTYSAGECVSIISEVPSAGCPSGLFLRADGLCQGADRINAVKSCPAGYVESTADTCTKLLTVSAVFTCNENYSLDNFASSCKRTVVSPANLICPQNSVRSGDLCYTSTTTGKIASCEQGLQYMSDATCRHTTTPTSACPSDYIIKDGVCASSTTSPLTLSCPPGTTETSSTTCQGMVRVNATPSCVDSSFTLSADQKSCLYTFTASPTLACPDSYAPSATSVGKCDSLSRAIKQGACPSGYNLLYGTICQKDTGASASVQCRAGLNFNPVSGFCEVIQAVNPIATCPSGWNWDSTNEVCKCLSGTCASATPSSLQASSQSQTQSTSQTQTASSQNQQTTEIKNAQGRYESVDGYSYAFANGSVGPNGGTVVNSNGQSYEIVQQEVSAPPSRTIYFPQYVVLPTNKNDPVRVITPSSPASPVYQSTGREGTYVYAPGVSGGNLQYLNGKN